MSSSASPPPISSSSSLTDNNTGATGIEEVQQQVASGGSGASSNLRAPTTQSSGAFASLPSPGDSNPRASLSSAVAAPSGLYYYTDNSAPVLPISDEGMVARACAEADDRDEGEKDKLKVQRPRLPEVDLGREDVLPISDVLMVTRVCAEADDRDEGEKNKSKSQRPRHPEVDLGSDDILPISDELMVVRACAEADDRDEDAKPASKTLVLRNNGEDSNSVPVSNPNVIQDRGGRRIANANANVAAPVLGVLGPSLARGSVSRPNTTRVPPANNHEDTPTNTAVATPTPFEGFVVHDDLEAVVEPVSQVYDGVRVESNINDRWKRRRNVGFALVVIFLTVTAVVLVSQAKQNPIVLPVLATTTPTTFQPSSSTYPTNEPSASQQPTTTPSQLPTVPPSLIPTSSSSPSFKPTSTPTNSILPSLAPTSTPSTSPTLAPTLSPSPSVLPSVSASPSLVPSSMPTFMWLTNCTTVKLEQGLLEESSDKHIAVDGAFAITTADNKVRFYNLVDGSWKQTLLLTVGTSSWLSPAISGNVAVVGAHLENGRTGAAYIYERDPISNVWNLATRLAPSDLTSNVWSGAQFGYSVAVDGDVVVVGAWNDLVGGNTGSVYVFRRDVSGGGWSQEAKLAPEDEVLDAFGASVDVKGNTVVVSDVWFLLGNEGEVFVYNYNSKNSTWSKFQDSISNIDCGALFGHNLVLTEDGELFIGCAGADSNAGAVYHYVPSNNGGLYEMRQKITASDRFAGDFFGYFFSVDGNLMVVGAYLANQGQVYIYTRDSPSGSWMEVTKILGPEGETNFAKVVSLSGNKFLVGAENNAYAYLLETCSGTTT